MRHKLIVLFFVCALQLSAMTIENVTVVQNDEVTLTASWKASSENDLAGYIVYWGKRCLSAEIFFSSDSLRLYDSFMDVGLDTFFVFPWYDDQPVYVAVIAYDTSLNFSKPSFEAAWAPLTFYDRYPKNNFISPFDGYYFRDFYGMTRNFWLYDTAYDLNGDGVIMPSDRYLFNQNYGRSTDEIFLAK